MKLKTMNNGTVLILDTIASHLGESLSISQLTEKIKEKHGTAYYANTYKKLKELQREKILLIESHGNSSIIKPNFENSLTVDRLVEMEIEKKIDFFKTRNHLSTVIDDLKDTVSDRCFVRSICSIDPLRNLQLNRFELLFMLLLPADAERETIQLYKDTLRLQNKYNLRIDSLILTENDFSSLIRSSEINPLREAIANETAILYPEAFWGKIREISQDSIIKVIQKETTPSKISESDLVGNLYRFGYKEFGSTIAESRKYCVEYIVTALLLSGDARRIDAIPIVLSKNSFKENVLAFLSQKYRTTGKLLGLLTILQKVSPSERVERAISILRTFGEKEILGNENSIIRNMELYDAIR